MFRASTKIAMVIGLSVLSAPAFAAFTMDELVDVTKVALKNFREKEPTHAQHSMGFKSWLSADDAKVKIYVTHDGMSMDFNYLCHKHDAVTECHAQ